MKQDTQDFLLEIDVEELPTSYVRPALGKLKASFEERLKAQRITHGDIQLFGTATMLICYIKDMAICQEELLDEVTGPPKKIAFDEKGNPTQVALGFMKAQGAKMDDLKVKSTHRGDYVYIERKIKARNTKDILKEIIPLIVNSIYFPKTMKWDSSGVRFARPIESILALFGRDRVMFKIGNVLAKKIEIKEPAKYLAKLEKEYLIDPDKRKRYIEGLIVNTQKKLNLDLCIDSNLLEEVNFMVSEPILFIGEFDRKFLSLPEDVLKASMSKYQRIFPLSKDNKLVNKFIAIIDKKKRCIEKVKGNYENILEARLKDSLFFYAEDTKEPLSEKAPRLKDLIFQKDLGNMFEKIKRLEELSLFICEKLNEGSGSFLTPHPEERSDEGSPKILQPFGLQDEPSGKNKKKNSPRAQLNIDKDKKNNIIRAAGLSKIDLTSHMVGEFPSLQGIMGKEYALKSGENIDVAIAIREQYLPQGLDSGLPRTIEGAVLAIADRIDNIAGFIGIGPEIKGSFDPYGIRRNAQGMIQIIKDKGFRLLLNEVIHKAIGLYNGKLKVSPFQLEDKIIVYIKERLEFLIGDIRPIELKQAVLAVRRMDIVDIFNRIQSLSSISNKETFLKAAKVVERTHNILKGVKEEVSGEVLEGIFKEDLEKEVWKAYLSNKDAIQGLINTEKYIDATALYGDVFFGVLGRFFDKVLVNIEDASLRMNRLRMMKAINALYTECVADLAKLPQIKL